MNDPRINQAEREDDETNRYLTWLHNNEEDIIETYADGLSIDDVPDKFIRVMYEAHLRWKDDEQ